MEYSGWYERNRARMTALGVWLRGGEINTLPPAEFDRRPYKILFARLSTYYDTGYSFTHQLLYQLASKIDGVYPDLAYLPPTRDRELFDLSHVPWLVGTQSKRGARDFDLLGLSNSIVQELLNIPTLLRKSGIPLKKSERLADSTVPLVILGGANSLYTSSLWESDPLVDGVFVGESEEAIKKIIALAKAGKEQGHSKRQILDELSKVAGFFEPDRPAPTHKAFIWSLNKSEPLEAAPVYYIEDQLGKGHLQISEGCPCFCSFCAESWDRKPYRERNHRVLKDAALKMKAAMGLDTVELYSFNFNMHSDFYAILWELAPHFKKIGLKSQRFDLLAHDPEMIEFQHAIEKASITCGLEGISPRLRRYLHKNLENPDLHKSLEAIFRSRARELKIFLIATGLEQEQDFTALADLLRHVDQIRSRCGQEGARVILSMTPLVRFPWTPLEFEDAYSIKHYHSIIKETARVVRAAGFEFRESADLPEYWVSQVMVRADHPGVARAWQRAVEETEFVYYREIPPAFQQALEKTLKEEGLEPEALLKGHSLEQSYRKPWAQVQTGVKRDFLWEEVVRARAYKEIDYCLGRAWQESKCFLCGGCPSPEHVLAIVKTKQTRSYTLAQLKARLKEARDSEVNVPILMEVGERGRGVPRKMVAVALARALMLSHPELTPFYRGYSGSYWQDEDGPCWVTGIDVLTLKFHRDALELLDRVAPEAIQSHFQGWGNWLGIAGKAWGPPRVELTGDLLLQPEKFLASKGLKYTLRKQPSGTYLYDFTGPSLKKGLVSELNAMRFPQMKVTFTPGPKFSLTEFLSEVVQWPDRPDWYRLQIGSTLR